MITKKILLREMLLLSPVYVCGTMLACSWDWLTLTVLYLLQPDHTPSATIQQCGHTIVLFELGKILMAVPAGILMEKFGRKPTLILIGCLNILAWLSLAAFRSLVVIYITRFLHGTVGGLTQTVSFPVIGEIASPQHRGTLTSFYNIFQVTGPFMAAMLNSIFRSYRAVQITGTVLSLSFIPTLYYLIETPEYLIQQKKYDKAEKNLKILRSHYTDAELEAEFASMRQHVRPKGRDNWTRYLKMKSVRKCLICVILLNVASTLTGSAIVNSYLTIILPENDYISSTHYPVVNHVLKTIFLVIFSAIIEMFSRKFLYVTCSLLVVFTLSIATVASYINLYYSTEYWKLIFIIDNFLYLIVDRTMNTLNNTLRTEVFPAALKGPGNAICTIGRSITIGCSAQIFSWINAYSYLYVTYVQFTVMSVFVAIIAYLYLPETRGKTLAEIQTALQAEQSQNKITNSNNDKTRVAEEVL